MSDSWSSLRLLLKERFPYPIAWAFEQYDGSRDDSLKLGHILYTAESLLQFVGSVVLLDGYEDLRQAIGPLTKETPRELSKEIKELFDVLRTADLQAPGIGLWQYALVRVLPKLRSCSLPELSQLLQNKLEWEAFCQNLDNLKNERNGLGHPWRRISDVTVHALLPQIEGMYFRLAASLKFLVNYCLAVVIEVLEHGEDVFQASLKLLAGERQDSDEVSVKIEQSLQPADLVLLRLAGTGAPLGRALILNPLYRVHGSLLNNQLSIYAYQRPLKDGISYYCVDNPDGILRLKETRAITTELSDPPRRFRRRDLGLSPDDLRKLRESIPQSREPIPQQPVSGPVNQRGFPSIPVASGPPIPPAGLLAPEPLPAPKPEAYIEPILTVPLPSPRTRRPRALVLVSGALVATAGAVYLAWPYIEPRPALTDLAVASMSRDADGWPDLLDAARTRVDAAQPDLAERNVERPWTLRTSGTTKQLFGVWGDGARLRVAVGELGTILVSEDAGAEWQARVLNGVPPPLLHAVAGSPSGTLIAVGRFGTIVRSRDRGKTWSGRRGNPTMVTLTGIYAGDGKRIFAVGDRGTLLRSEDDGETWEQLAIPVGTLLRGIWGRSANDLYAAGWDGMIVHSADGLHFQRVQSQTAAWLWGGYSDPVGGVFVVGKKGRVLRSLDHGKSFRPVVTGHPTALTSIWGNERGDLWLTGQEGIFHSNDRGATWTPDTSGVLSDTHRKLNQIWGSAGGELLAVGDGGIIVQRYLPTYYRAATASGTSATR